MVLENFWVTVSFKTMADLMVRETTKISWGGGGWDYNQLCTMGIHISLKYRVFSLMSCCPPTWPSDSAD